MFQSTRPRRGAMGRYLQPITLDDVSIHAPPEGRDDNGAKNPASLVSFNPRAPGGARSTCPRSTPPPGKFQSTRPRRGAMRNRPRSRNPGPCFNPRAPGGARFRAVVRLLPQGIVSIHAPPEGRDVFVSPCPCCQGCFNPRAPGGARYNRE